MFNLVKIDRSPQKWLSLVVVCVAVLLSRAYAQELPQGGGLPGGHVRALVIDPSAPTTLYAGTLSGGVFKSTSGGTSWVPVNAGLANRDIMALAIDPVTPATLYAGTNGGGLFKTTNGGIDWKHVDIRVETNAGSSAPVAHMPFAPRVINTLAIDPSAPATIYAGSGDGTLFGMFAGVFKSTNGGTSWVAVNSGLTNVGGDPFSVPKEVETLAIDPSAPATLYAGTYDGVFRTTNGGSTWDAFNGDWKASKQPIVNSLAISHSASTTIYAGSDIFGIFKRTKIDGGSWVAVKSDAQVYTLVIDPTDPNTLYAGTYAGVFKSSNGGNTWTPVNSGLANLDVHALAIDPSAPGTIYAGSDGGGIFKTAAGRNSWVAANSGLNAATVTGLVIDPTTPTTLYAGTLGNGVFKSTNGGSSWVAMKVSGLINGDARTLALDPRAHATVYVQSKEGDGDVLKTTNGGTSWSAITSSLKAVVIAFAVDPSTPGTLYVATNGYEVFRSTNGGTSWSTSSNLSPDVTALVVDPSNSSTLYAGTDGGGVFKSTNRGTSWTAINAGLGDKKVVALAAARAVPAVIYAITGGGAFRSSDGGSNWTAINSGLPKTGVQALVVDPSSPATVYAATPGDGVFKSTNGGVSWAAANSGLTSPIVYTLAIDPSTPTTIYAGTQGGGVYKSINSGSTWQPTGANAGSLPAASTPAPQISRPNQDAAQPIQLYQAVSLQDLVGVLKAAGYEAQTVSDDTLAFTINSVRNIVHLYGCDESHQCKSFAFNIGFTGTGITPDFINEFNSKRRWVHVWLNSQGNPSMTWDVSVDGGVTYQYLARTVNMWRDLVAMFANSLLNKKIP